MESEAPSIRRRTVIIGVIVAAVIGSVLALGISRMGNDTSFVRVNLDGTKPAPNLTGKDLMTNADLSLGDFRGKPVVINVWAEWCGPCRDEAPILKAFTEQNPDVAVLGINTYNERKPAQRFNTNAGWTYPSIFDAEGHIAFEVLKLANVPGTFYIDANGVLRGKSPGPVSLDELNDAASRLREPQTADRSAPKGRTPMTGAITPRATSMRSHRGDERAMP